MATLSEAQARQFFAAAKGDRFEALYTLALTTGMRQGELLALRWQDIDLTHESLHVRMNVQESEGRFIMAEVKTTYSRRNIALTSTAIEALRRHRAAQLEERLRLGAAWNTSLELVFPNRIGGINDP